MSLFNKEETNKNIYFVTVIETLKKRVEVEAENEEDALVKVENAYKRCDFILDENDFTGVKFKIAKVIEQEDKVE